MLTSVALFPFPSGREEEKVELLQLLQLSNIHEVCNEEFLYCSSQQMWAAAAASDKLALHVSSASGNEAIGFHITVVQQTLQEPKSLFHLSHFLNASWRYLHHVFNPHILQAIQLKTKRIEVWKSFQQVCVGGRALVPRWLGGGCGLAWNQPEPCNNVTATSFTSKDQDLGALANSTW